jgi:predicted nucleic acid-binding protein
MKPIKGRIFLDSNILIYSYSNSEPDKQVIAQKCIAENDTFISTQVLTELANIVTRKFNFSYDDDAQIAIKESCDNNNLHINTPHTIIKACEISKKHNLSFYDSLIIAAALDTKCTILLSEDMSDGYMIDNILTIKNPFV